MFGEAALILDKSAFQGLSPDEHIERSIAYRENIPPVLLREILCDLAKEDTRDGPEHLVQTLAKKFLGSGGVINAHYRKLCLASLHGERFPMDGRPLIDDFSEFIDEHGNGSILIDVGEGNRAILRWAGAQFGARERWMATAMRKSAQSISTDALRGRLRAHRVLLPRPKAIAELPSIADDILARPSMKRPLVDWLVEQLGLPAKIRQAAVAAWERTDVPLARGAPYAFHCMRVLLMLVVGMSHKVLTDRPTNKIDAEYLFYLPFCALFVSDDRLHRQLTPFLLREDQAFMSLAEFKTELSRRRRARETDAEK